ncbi:hypothetical protein chiPu_0006887 [Chiloscyllium punctatum]|uniref:Uncharacterized protein n=1 Tax=Chiloscyllium punctatum TaxID=137246 RepID=A0A401SDG7_CHIPU|nr:hypothetical protein [Chiloscyllium punctatum]
MELQGWVITSLFGNKGQIKDTSPNKPPLESNGNLQDYTLLHSVILMAFETVFVLLLMHPTVLKPLKGSCSVNILTYS